MSIDLHLDLHPAHGTAGVVAAGGGRLAAPAGMPGDIVRVGAASPLVRVAREAFRLGDIDFLCFGESDHAAPEGAIAALKLALDRGETRYPDIRGLPPLRAALAAYLTGLHQRPVSESRVAVTASGMAALTVAFSALLREGDQVVVVSPSWPNPTSLARTRGASVHEFALGYGDDGFRLDLDALEATLAGTRLLFLNSPNNPTGWCASDAELAAILAMCRRHGVWIVSDDVYSRLVFDGREAAPSILDHAEPEDRVIVCNSFSKAWAMTGFRVGWLVVPEGLRDEIGELIEITHSGVAPFTQRAAIAALADEAFVRQFRDYCARGRAVVDAAFAGLAGVRYRPPVAAFYAFAQIEGLADSGEFAMRLVREQRIAVAPGGAFGPAGEGFIRICFAQDSARLAPAMARFTQSLASLEPSC
ncbi:pyridoxal phosphate-dependent aminotransferase [Burkholderia plantarii]|uniref:pyridoxal phosphate-dependent aminotransferase n=1 Tax=Burkholderia plantarii TaxID=41899 RepID=UPI0018DB2BC2|nr:pyridoxal phosphate-dependent aminotransferase [Burkholderia plantarii]MBI0326446.1 pyridoxal phosphate-dependent aminotransferase [Burkholderia plantarii]